jgi:hypothetical protein
LDGTNLCGASGAKSGARVNMYMLKDTNYSRCPRTGKLVLFAHLPMHLSIFGKFVTDVAMVSTMPRKPRHNPIRLNANFGAFTNFAKECFPRIDKCFSSQWNNTSRNHKHSNAHGSLTTNRSLPTAHALPQNKRDYRSNSCGNSSPLVERPALALRTKNQQKHADLISRALPLTSRPPPSHGRQQRNPRPRKKPNYTIPRPCPASITQLGCQYPIYPPSKRTRNLPRHHHNADSYDAASSIAQYSRTIQDNSGLPAL